MNHVSQREIAVNALMEITSKGGYNNIVLRNALKKNNNLDRVSKAFITEVVNGSLRNLIYLDYCINYFSKTTTEKMKPFILNVLRIGVYQILFLDKTPDSAACNEAVIMTKKKFQNLAGFVNGLLRNISRNKDNIKIPDKDKDILSHLSVLYSCPKWIIEYWLAEMDIAQIENILKNSNKAPYLTICTNTLKIDRDKLIDRLGQTEIITKKGLLEHSIYISNTSDLTEGEEYKDGLYHVMDESSMLAVKILDPEQGQTVIDVCAAPGGKSFYASYLMNNQGKISSYDIHKHKIDLMLETRKRLGISNMDIKILDASIFQEELENSADCLILDVPCSGLGLIKKKPDIKYTKSIDEIKKLVGYQLDIVKACWRYVKPGGTLIYSTCTISKMENLDNLNYIIREFPFKPVGFFDLLPSQFRCETAHKGYVQILPDQNNTDGFFIGKLYRI